jgi:hypothetical protein
MCQYPADSWISREELESLPTNLIIQNLLIMIVLVESAKEPDNIRVLIKHKQWLKPADVPDAHFL